MHQVEPYAIAYQIAYAWVMTAPEAYVPERPYCPQAGPLWQSLGRTTKLKASTNKTESICDN